MNFTYNNCENSKNIQAKNALISLETVRSNMPPYHPISPVIFRLNIYLLCSGKIENIYHALAPFETLHKKYRL